MICNWIFVLISIPTVEVEWSIYNNYLNLTRLTFDGIIISNFITSSIETTTVRIFIFCAIFSPIAHLFVVASFLVTISPTHTFLVTTLFVKNTHFSWSNGSISYTSSSTANTFLMTFLFISISWTNFSCMAYWSIFYTHFSGTLSRIRKI